MKIKINLSLEVPMGGYQLKFVNVYQTNKKLIAVSELTHRSGMGTASFCTIQAPQIEVSLPFRSAFKSIDYYVVNEGMAGIEPIDSTPLDSTPHNNWALALLDCIAGVKTINFIKSQDDIRDLIASSRCIYGSVPAELKLSGIKSEAKAVQSSLFAPSQSSAEVSSVKEVKPEFRP